MFPLLTCALMRQISKGSLLLAVVFWPLAAVAQSPTSFSVFPSTIYKAPSISSCYTIAVGNGANMTVDTRYRLGTGSEQILYGWPTLDANGQAYICTDSVTATGVYTFTGVRRTGSGDPFLQLNVQLTVLPTPPQPASLTFNGSTNTFGYAGNSTYTLHADGAPGSSIEVEYAIYPNPGQPPIAQGTTTIPLDASGNWTYSLGHYDTLGQYVFTRMRNVLRPDWVSISVSYTIRPPNPTWLTLSPSTVVAGQGAYTMSAGNAANVTLDVRYTLDSGTGEMSQPDIIGWPFLSPVTPGSADGRAGIQVGPCTRLGTYRFKFIENTLNPGVWQPVNPATGFVSVTAPGSPTITARTPAAAKVGTNGNLAIEGTNLCGVSLTTTYPGLTFGSIPEDYASAGTSVTATFNVSAGAQPGTATVALAARGGTTTFQFYVASTAPPAITGFSPASVPAGTATTVTIMGNNLIGGTLTANVPGITFDNITYNPSGTSMTARFVVSSTTPVGNCTITITTPAGFASRAFAIAPAGAGALTSSKEYIYLGGRLLAVETTAVSAPPASTEPVR